MALIGFWFKQRKWKDILLYSLLNGYGSSDFQNEWNDKLQDSMLSKGFTINQFLEHDTYNYYECSSEQVNFKIRNKVDVTVVKYNKANNKLSV